MRALIDALTQTKECRICSERKPLEDFHPNKTCSLGVVGTCKLCSSVRVRGWYKNNRNKRQQAANKRNQQRRDECVDALGGECMRCGGLFPRCVYDFHHRDPTTKVDAISNLLSKPKLLKEELKKCDLLCANCHRVKHHEEGL